MRKIAAILIAGGMVVGWVAPAGAAKPKTVWEDPSGDAGLMASEVGQPLPGMDQAGFDLVGGAIAVNKKNLDFTVTHAGMPPMGAPPEGFRFLWAFAVNNTSYRVTVKSVDVGKPNPVDQSDMDRIGQVNTDGFFRLEGDCGVSASAGGVSFIGCPTIAYLEGSFDAASNSFTFSVPMKDVKAKPGSVLTTGTGDSSTLCGGQAACWISHVAERSSDRTQIDLASWTTKYKIPKKK